MIAAWRCSLAESLRDADAETLTGDALHAFMRHKSYQTTQRHINLASQLNRAVEAIHVPDVLR